MFFRSLISSAIGVMLAPSSSLALPSESIIADYPNISGSHLGAGWQIENGEPTTAVCIDAQVSTDTSSYERTSYQKVVDSSSIMQALSADASFRAGFFTGKVSASVKFAQSATINASDETVLAVATVQKSTTYLTPVGTTVATGGAPIVVGTNMVLPVQVHAGSIKLRDDFAAMAQTDPINFRKICGDGFVEAITTGGAMYILYKFQQASEVDRRSVEGAMSGSVFSISATANASQILQQYTSSDRLRVDYASSGGVGPIPTTLDQLNVALHDFPVAVNTAPASLNELIIPYNNLLNYPAKADSGKDAVINRVIEMYYEFDFIRRTANAIIGGAPKVGLLPGAFGLSSADIARVQAIADQADGFADKLHHIAANCVAAASCVYPSDVDSNDYQLRAQLPIPDSGPMSFAVRERNRAERRTLRDDVNQVKHAMTEIPPDDPNFQQKKSDAEMRIAALSDAIAAMDAAVKAAPVEYWVRPISEFRCDHGLERPCLKNAEIQQLIDKYGPAAAIN